MTAKASPGIPKPERALRNAREDIVLMDIRMPGMDGIEATRTIVAADGPQVIVVTTFGVDEYVFQALRAGASGFLLKNTPPEQLAEAVRLVSRDYALIAPEVTHSLIEAFARTPIHPLPRPHSSATASPHARSKSSPCWRVGFPTRRSPRRSHQ